MLSVFICYGGVRGKRIGEKLRSFLRNEGFDAFLASPGSSDIPSGLDFKKEIERRLRNAHVMVAICDKGLISSQNALEEICLANQLQIPIILFKEKKLKREQLPPHLRGYWSPLEFRSLLLKRKYLFLQLEIQIYRLVIFKIECQGRLLGNQPTEIGIPPQILRVSS